ncbi:plasminogen-binding N-terminal domain-containing protein [Helicobacter sp. 11S02629-2]|uniref:plasminogen-binding N-terminal domain-containing protein n=1 Tax=Helicobacter sp. 11S02629-2 TaxID=1476195 RepID=UPI000BA71CB6|nr:plasminogen-binding N-terminal domain-containing protein [Helicobacter sp. 11S02629-2]PAF44132.1 hypothetical protein BKH40_05905 [Helicobacter sp. 11S02629-2]
MKTIKMICILLFLSQGAFAFSLADLTTPVDAKVLSYDKKDSTIIISSPKELLSGENGLIKRSLDSYTAIVDMAVIESKVNKDTLKDVANSDETSFFYKAKVKKFDEMNQVYLPNPQLSPTPSDTVSFHLLNQKAFLIAPNQESFDALKSKVKDVDFLSPDLLMGYLAQDGRYDPTPKALKEACDVYGVGLVFIMGSKEYGVLECQTNTLLYKEAFNANTTKPMTPFFTRVSFPSSGSLFSLFSSKKSKGDYFKYYDALLSKNIGE